MESKKRLKVLFLADWYPSEENPVAGIFVREHAKAVALYDDVTVIAFSGVSSSLRRLYEVSLNIKDGIKTINFRHKKSPIPETNWLIRIWGVLSYFRMMLKQGYKPDIIHAHVYFAGVSAVVLGWLYKIPVVITEHWTGFPMKLLTTNNKILARFAMNRAEIILPVSESLKKAIENYGIKNKFQVVPNVVNSEMFYPLSNGSEKKSEIKRILMVALISPKKGVPYLLKALHRIKKERQDFILDIVGDGPNRSEYEKQVDELGIGDMVKFHGLKPKEEVAQFMRQCDFFVLPSLVETFGVVYIEALSSGKPVIAANIGGPKEIIIEEVGLLVLPKDIDALTEAIEYMLDHCQDYSIEKIAQYAIDRFSYEAVGQMLDGVYRELARRGDKGPQYQ